MKKVRKYFIKTFGCQMNVADSEKIAAWYKAKGWQPAADCEEADEAVINTCSVRASAEHRVYGLINNLKKLTVENPSPHHPRLRSGQGKLKIILTGCMLRYPLRKLKEELPEVAEFKRISNFILKSKILIPKSSFVPISNGCNNFCSYCVVPYSRGKEKSRPFDEIVCEVQELVKRGIKEITLLGQNVNSYGKDLYTLRPVSFKGSKFKTPFAQLLDGLHALSLEKISFLTSNPWDLNDEIIEAMKLSKVDRYLHLPLQSGDDEILNKMNRKYTAGQYLSLVNKIKKRIPDIQFGTDIIVGFPGETKKQFQNTFKLCKKIGFVKAYINKYSPREGTAAFRLKDTVSPQEKKRRWWILENLINLKFSQQ